MASCLHRRWHRPDGKSRLHAAVADGVAVAFLAIEGLVLVLLSFTVRNELNWEWNVFSGLLSLLLAALLWAGLPSTAAWGLGLMLGVDLLTTGLGLVFLGRGSEELIVETAETPA